MRRMLPVFLFAALALTLQSQSRYTGEGGRGIRIVILAPRGENLSKDEAYLPVLVQNWLTGGFNKFSAMTVIDRQNQEAVTLQRKIV